MKSLLIGLGALVIVGAAGYLLSPKQKMQGPDTLKNYTTTKQPTMPQGLHIEDITVGNGTEAVPGALITVDYVGTLANGTKFDSSIDREQPFQFVLGKGTVIKGWDEGVKGMKVGGKRKLVIPPDLGYGAKTYGPIPANSTLTFEVDLLNVQLSQEP